MGRIQVLDVNTALGKTGQGGRQMRKRIKLVVAYDGTNYCGWQLQKNGITIEEVLNRELTALLCLTHTIQWHRTRSALL